MKAVIRRVAVSVPVTLEEIDISGDVDLERLYGVEIPVLMADGKKVAKYRIRESELVRVLTKGQGPRAKG